MSRSLVKFGLVMLLLLMAGFWAVQVIVSPVVAVTSNPYLISNVHGLGVIQTEQVIAPVSEQEIVNYVKNSEGLISIGGSNYSLLLPQPEAVKTHLDLSQFNRVINFDVAKKQMTVEAGTTWLQILPLLEENNLSFKAPHEFNGLSVGSSLSVNSQSRNLKTSSILASVESIRIVLADGNVYRASRNENQQLFYGAAGSFGSLGIITHVTLNLDENVPLTLRSGLYKFTDYATHFLANTLDDDNVYSQYAILYPPHFEDVMEICWQLSGETENIKGLQVDLSVENSNQSIINNFLLTHFSLAQAVRKRVLDPLRLRHQDVYSRNHVDNMDEYRFDLSSSKHGMLSLQSFYVPVNSFETFVLRMRNAFIRNNAKIHSVLIHYMPGTGSHYFARGNEEMFTFHIYYDGGSTNKDAKKVAKWSQALIQGAVESGGGYLLPSQAYTTREQMFYTYPRAHQFFALKQKADPKGRFNPLL